MSNTLPTLVLLSYTGIADETKEYNFVDGSITYFEFVLKNAFDYVLVDNIGSGLVRVSYNRLALDITNYTNGAKTLKSNDSLYMEETVWNIKLFFVQSSTIEIILKSTELK